jgi:CDP-diacylglycerol--serine O-phosphatidyltransferase
MKKHIPNFLTCCNLLCGTLGIIYILDGYPWGGDATLYLGANWLPAYFVWLACVFDFFDGFAARALKVSSPIGKELDSLADMVSFGLLPALFMFKYIESRSGEMLVIAGGGVERYLPYVALLIAVFSALRLAVFNIDETQKDTFKGVPTPANTLFITGLPFIENDWIQSSIFSPWGLAIISIIFSLFLVSRFELFALKFKSFRWADNKLRFTFLIAAVLLMCFLGFSAIPLIILLYIVLSLGSKARSHSARSLD